MIELSDWNLSDRAVCGWLPRVTGYSGSHFLSDTVVAISKNADDVIVVEGREAYYVLTNGRVIE